MYAGNSYMTYPTFPMQYPATPIGLIPVELDIEGLYEDHDRRRRKNGNEKIVASHVHSVRTFFAKFLRHRLTISSDVEHKIELPKGLSEIGRRSI
jgi:hypothetical protein